MPIFSPDLQQEPWVIKIQALYKQLAVDIAAIHAAEAAQRATDDANRQAVLLVQQQRRDAAEAQQTEYTRLRAIRMKLIEQARIKQNAK